MPSVEIKDYNVLIDGSAFFELPIKNIEETYEKKNSYQQASKVLFTFVPNKKYGQLITVSPETLIILKTVNTENSFIEIWFIDQDNRPLEIEDSVNISLIVGISNFM